MARSVFYVVTHGQQWRIKYGDQHYGPYATQKAAIRQAVDWARDHGKKGHDAQVLIQGVGGQWRTEWTYGHDPYPPPE